MFDKLFMLPKLAKYAAARKKWLDLLEFDIRNVDVSKDKLSCTISFPEKLVGNDGIIHGGITCFVIDSIAGMFAMLSHNDPSKKALTKDLYVTFLEPIKPDTVYTVIATHVSDTIRVIISDANSQEMSIGIVTIVFK